MRDTNVKNVVLLQSVLQQVGRTSIKSHNHLRDLVRVQEKGFFVFSNEFHCDCFIEPTQNETISQYQQRFVLRAAEWYTKHLEKAKINCTVVVLTDDDELKSKSQQIGVKVFSTEEFVESLPKDLCLIDKVVKMAGVESFADADFPPHMPLAEIQAGLKAGQLFEGTYFQSRYNFKEGNVRVHSNDQSILIHGLKHINRALHDDTVAIEILPKEQWKKESDLVLGDENDQETEGNEEDEAHLLEEDDVEQIKQQKDEADVQPTGRVVGIIRRKYRQYCGVLQPSQLAGVCLFFFISILSYLIYNIFRQISTFSFRLKNEFLKFESKPDRLTV